MSTGRDELLMAVVDYNLGHPEFDELSDIGDGQHLCSVAADLIHELRRELSEKQEQIFELEEQLAKEKAARKEAESEANANEEELAVVEELLHQSRQRIEQLEAENERLLSLLKVATCPACDGSGAIPHGPLPDGSWEAEQCQWCDERKQALAQPQEADHD